MSNAGSLLCIDAGNTLVKWCLHAGANIPFEKPSAFFSHPTAEFKPFTQSFLGLQRYLAPTLNPSLGVKAVLLSNVLGPDFEEGVRALCDSAGVPLHVLTVNRHAEVQSAYENPASLGKDRWAACMALLEVSQAKVNLMVSFGTATTLDVVIRGKYWQHLGGFIVPGVETMLRSLHSNTAELPLVDLGKSRATSWPVNTQQAIGLGVARMQKTMVDSVAAELESEHGSPVAIWLTGGGAPAMHVHLPKARLLEYAVFKGLLLDYRLTEKGAAA
ncbi:MAG: type III pantothenate kinase [Burkholderiales bacterium]|uniref:type III pantothenate kinase n=1 Tax=Limnobacter sp. TaxID=2003368 RepID=UPI00392979BB|nr:type III pantothenate kinase [Burkholderiales bacterium]